MDPQREAHLLSAFGARLSRTAMPKLSTDLSAVAMGWTISKDNTAGDSHMQDCLLGEWGQKNRPSTVRSVTPSETSPFGFERDGGMSGDDTGTFRFSTEVDGDDFSFGDVEDIFNDFRPGLGGGGDGADASSVEDFADILQPQSRTRIPVVPARHPPIESYGEQTSKNGRRDQGTFFIRPSSVDNAGVHVDSVSRRTGPPPSPPPPGYELGQVRAAVSYEEAEDYHQRPIRQPSVDRSVSSVDSHEAYDFMGKKMDRHSARLHNARKDRIRYAKRYPLGAPLELLPPYLSESPTRSYEGEPLYDEDRFGTKVKAPRHNHA